MALIARIFVILFAFLVASGVAACVFMFGYLEPIWSEVADQPASHDLRDVVLLVGAILIAGYALIPTLLVVIIAEGFGLRSVLLYAFAGAACGLFGAIGLGFGTTPATHGETEVAAAAGIAAGFVYWALAGRTAGAWRRRPVARGPAGQ